jgi:predicted porin
MKKTLIALAAVAVTGVAFAQSSVTIYGKVNVSLTKANGSSTQMNDIHGSRLGFKVVEDLGGGLKANAQIEHRFTPDTGAQSGDVMWNGLSTVGVSGAFGEIKLGRFYSANFLGANNKPDPFGGDGQGALRGIGMQTTYVRTANIIHYGGSFGGVKVALSTGLKEGAAHAHNSVAVSYAAGPLDVGAGTDQGADDGSVTNAYVTYDFGVVKLAAGLGNKKNPMGVKTNGFLVGATIPAGPGRVLVGFARAKVDGAAEASNQKIGLGYAYPLSKRTTLEATYGRDSKQLVAGTTKKVGGVDFTLHHNF